MIQGPHFKARIGVVLMAFGFIAISPSQAQEASFTILKGDDVVGSIKATRTDQGKRTMYLMASHSEFDIIWKHVVRSMVSTDYSDGAMSNCHSWMTVNGTMRDSSHFAPALESANCFVHPKSRFTHTGSVDWTTARMYFEEPIDQRSIFVESVLRSCPLESTGQGMYSLSLPDNKVNHYLYRDGVLQEIKVDRSLFDLVFRRN